MPTGIAATNTHGSASANADAVRGPSPSPAFSTAPKTGVPTAGPSSRKRSAVDVAVPRSRWSTLFCTASSVVCITNPTPRPSTPPNAMASATGVDCCSVASSATPIVMSTEPLMGQRR